ncbi:MAG: hypothetical protein AB7L13_23155 [Acidimicrobiia bacterium]
MIVVFVFGIFIVEGAITLRDRGIFVFFGLTRRTRVSRTESAEGLWAGLLELSGFFEAPVATLLHGRAPGLGV